jgi:TusA-related sulfurtransferase
VIGIPGKADRRLDTLGYYCPIPLIRTSQAIQAMESGDVLELVSDDRGVLADIPDWCTGHGHDYLGHRQVGTTYRLYIRKG